MGDLICVSTRIIINRMKLNYNLLDKKQNREILYKKMDSIIISKSIIVPLFYDEVIRFVSNDINGMKINATNLLDLRTVKKKN